MRPNIGSGPISEVRRRRARTIRPKAREFAISHGRIIELHIVALAEELGMALDGHPSPTWTAHASRTTRASARLGASVGNDSDTCMVG